jgi:hypothetical protein
MVPSLDIIMVFAPIPRFFFSFVSANPKVFYLLGIPEGDFNTDFFILFILIWIEHYYLISQASFPDINSYDIISYPS